MSCWKLRKKGFIELLSVHALMNSVYWVVKTFTAYHYAKIQSLIETVTNLVQDILHFQVTVLRSSELNVFLSSVEKVTTFFTCVKSAKVCKFHFPRNYIKIGCGFGKKSFAKGSFASNYKFKQEPKRKSPKKPEYCHRIG